MKRLTFTFALLYSLAGAQQLPNLGVVTALQIIAIDPVPLPRVGYSTSPEACFNYLARDAKSGTNPTYQPPELDPPASTSGGASTYRVLRDACYIVLSDPKDRPALIFDITQNFRPASHELSFEISEGVRLLQQWSDELDLYDYSVYYDQSPEEGLLINIELWVDQGDP